MPIQIADAVGTIADAAQSNAEDLAQVSDIFRILDQSTQQNAAMVEESNAGLQALSGETHVLIGAIARFSSDQPSGPSGGRLGLAA